MNALTFIVLTGQFAAGKDTQADILKKKIGESSEIISTGDIYRSAKSRVGEYAGFYPYIAPYVEDIDTKGMLLPDGVMTQMVEEVISKKMRYGKETFIFTGFPRTIGQLEFFDKMLSDFKKEFDVNCVFIEYKISDETSLLRSHLRRSEMEKRGEKPRPYDCDEGIVKRISTYYREVEPMIKKLESEARLFTIDANGAISNIEKETASILSSRERM